MRLTKLLQRIGQGDVANIDFCDLVRLVKALGFEETGGRVRQVVELVRRYDLKLEE